MLAAYIAILFADIRSFTKLSEKKLPYDVVFLLNRYFDSMGSAVSDCGGHLDKFIGDGVMALFGIEDGAEAGSKAALAAALGKTETQVRVFFQNARQRARLLCVDDEPRSQSTR